MDFIIFEFTVALACVFLYLYTRDLGMVYLGIVSGFLFILAGLPIVATDTLDFQNCFIQPTNSTEEAIIIDANHTDTTIVNLAYSQLCFSQTYNLPWRLKEGFGVFFLLIGIGTILAVSHNQKKSGEDE
jgi:hypothetical protein